MMIETIKSTILEVWSKVSWVLNNEVPVFRFIFVTKKQTFYYNSSNLHRPNIQSYQSYEL